MNSVRFLCGDVGWLVGWLSRGWGVCVVLTIVSLLGYYVSYFLQIYFSIISCTVVSALGFRYKSELSVIEAPGVNKIISTGDALYTRLATRISAETVNRFRVKQKAKYESISFTVRVKNSDKLEPCIYATMKQLFRMSHSQSREVIA